MTTEHTQVPTHPGRPSRPERPGSSVHVVRARKLLVGGLIGGLAGAVISLVLFGILYGSPGVLSAALAAAMVLFFYVAGQLVMVAFADAGARTLLAVSMASYTARIVILGLVLLLYAKHTAALAALVPMAVFLTTVIVVALWLAVEVWVFTRLRIDLYDTPYAAPEQREGEQ